MTLLTGLARPILLIVAISSATRESLRCQPGERSLTLKLPPAPVSGGFVHLYTAIDNKLFRSKLRAYLYSSLCSVVGGPGSRRDSVSLLRRGRDLANHGIGNRRENRRGAIGQAPLRYGFSERD